MIKWRERNFEDSGAIENDMNIEPERQCRATFEFRFLIVRMKFSIFFSTILLQILENFKFCHRNQACDMHMNSSELTRTLPQNWSNRRSVEPSLNFLTFLTKLAACTNENHQLFKALISKALQLLN